MSPLPDSSWVGEFEFVECFAPAHDALFFDEACGLVGSRARLSSMLMIASAPPDVTKPASAPEPGLRHSGVMSVLVMAG